MRMICKRKGRVVNVGKQFCLSPLGGVGMLLVSARETAEHPAVIRTAPPAKIYLASNVRSSEVKKA